MGHAKSENGNDKYITPDDLIIDSHAALPHHSFYAGHRSAMIN
jgi:hypothetical protein